MDICLKGEYSIENSMKTTINSLWVSNYILF